jgi:hypothetical protein
MIAGGVAQAGVHTLVSGEWTQAPAGGAVGSTVTASATLTGGVSISLEADKLSDAGESSKVGYDWETEYTVTSLILVTPEGNLDPLSGVSLTNYNNNDAGNPTEFLFIGSGIAANGHRVTFEAYWDSTQDALDLTNFPTSVGAGLTSGSVNIAIPEPAEISLMGLVLAGIARRKRS